MGNDKAKEKKVKGLFSQIVGGDMKEMLAEGKDALKMSKEELPILKEKINFIENLLMVDFLIKHSDMKIEDKDQMKNNIIEKISERL